MSLRVDGAFSTGSRTGLPLVPPAPLADPTAHGERRQLLLDQLQAEMRACHLCVESGYLRRADSVAGYRGRIGDRLMLIGQAPGHLSVQRGVPFSGPGGAILDRWLQRAGFAPGALHREVYISALTKCDPGKSPRGNGDRKPSPAEQALCRPFLLRELELVRPRAIALVGGMAIETFLGPGPLEDVVGTAVERNGVVLVPLPHPSGVSRWLNDLAHQALLEQGLRLIGDLRTRWTAETAASTSANESSLLSPLKTNGEENAR